MKLSIRNRLFICFGLIVMMMIGLSIFSIKSMDNINTKSKEMMQLWFTGLDCVHSINTDIADYRGKEYRHISLNGENEIVEVEKEMKIIKDDIYRSFDDYMETVYLEEDKKLIEELKKEVESYLEISDKVIQLSEYSKKEEANTIMLTQSLDKFKNIKNMALELVDYNENNAQNDHENTVPTYDSFKKIFLICMIIIIIVSIFLALFISKNINNKLKIITKNLKDTNDFDLKFNEELHDKKTDEFKNKDELSDTIDGLAEMRKSIRNIIKNIQEFSNKVEHNANNMYNRIKDTSITFQGIADATDDLAKGATDQAINAEEAVLKLDNLSKNIEITVENSVQIEKYVDEINKVNKEGNKAIVELKESISDNINILSQVVSQVDILDNESNSIGQITETIKSIADQTNLLALNAMIEAARAGEAGKGFAVVAQEIRKLADQVTDNVDNIENTINTIKLEINSTKQKMHDSKEMVLNTEKTSNMTEEKFEAISNAITHIVKQIDNLVNNIQKIDNDKNVVVNSIQEISAVTEQSSASTQQISASIQQQVAIIEEISNSSEELEQIAKQLKDIVDEFKL
ncbi:methyl-accepting chemotaxis protein [Tepidibacter hydrothermalis]|uniref:Methyl-accepting chemotaxis protein n=1 Tax=Tepidibacter hydrothermalis TaxID=3036126 RepID=A0ABY8EAW8_9FIRM|nr:methyl-accepting chemotaxis protein [Tepidibacter hydrothermalis]WFD10067.1 methyl-accepting chemotaxis protein [Tepidibacter hydrothermalis]